MNCPDSHFIRLIYQWQNVIELMLSIPSLVANIYFAFRFGLLGTFHPNLKIILITTNISGVLISVIHPILSQIPRDFYSTENPSMLGVFVAYSLIFCHSVMILLLDVKFLLIGLERKYAMDLRHSYEKHDGSWAKRLIYKVVFCLVLFVAFKNVSIFLISNSKSMDERLMEAFQFESVPFLCFITNGFVIVSFSYALYHFCHLKRHSQHRRIQAQSLSESYQIHEIQMVVDVLKPLASAYIFLDCLCGLAFCVAVYYVYCWPGCTVHSMIYKVWINCVYVFNAIYVFVASIFMIWEFSAVRQQFLNDLNLLTGIRFGHNKVEPQKADAQVIQNQYFDQLKSQWN